MTARNTLVPASVVAAWDRAVSLEPLDVSRSQRAARQLAAARPADARSFADRAASAAAELGIAGSIATS